MDEQEMQMAEYQMKQIQQVLESIDEQISNVNDIIHSLIEFKSLKGGEEVLFPLANGIFAKGTVSENKTLKMNVGNNIVVEKTVDQAIEMMNKQSKEMNDYKKDIETQRESILKKIEDT